MLIDSFIRGGARIDTAKFMLAKVELVDISEAYLRGAVLILAPSKLTTLA